MCGNEEVTTLKKIQHTIIAEMDQQQQQQQNESEVVVVLDKYIFKRVKNVPHIYKILKPEFCRIAEVSMLRKEYSVGRQFLGSSPYIMEYYDTTLFENNFAILVEPLEETKVLLEFMREHYISANRFLSLEIILNLALQMLSGIEVMHKLRFVYNSGFPNMLLVDSQLSKIKIICFRFASSTLFLFFRFLSL